MVKVLHRCTYSHCVAYKQTLGCLSAYWLHLDTIVVSCNKCYPVERFYFGQMQLYVGSCGRWRLRFYTEVAMETMTLG